MGPGNVRQTDGIFVSGLFGQLVAFTGAFGEGILISDGHIVPAAFYNTMALKIGEEVANDVPVHSDLR